MFFTTNNFNKVYTTYSSSWAANGITTGKYIYVNKCDYDIFLKNLVKPKVSLDPDKDILWIHPSCVLPRTQVRTKYKIALKKEKATVLVYPDVAGELSRRYTNEFQTYIKDDICCLLYRSYDRDFVLLPGNEKLLKSECIISKPFRYYECCQEFGELCQDFYQNASSKNWVNESEIIDTLDLPPILPQHVETIVSLLKSDSKQLAWKMLSELNYKRARNFVNLLIRDFGINRIKKNVSIQALLDCCQSYNLEESSAEEIDLIYLYKKEKLKNDFEAHINRIKNELHIDFKSEIKLTFNALNTTTSIILENESTN
ncbi:MAG TPA: hypothetical protein PK626_00035 [Bacteroidales bacterium]|nr:hypothetical protein [Bacteroidales bacterium]